MKYSFGLRVGKFLGYMMTRKAIEANLDQIQAFEEMPSPEMTNKMHRLKGRLAVLSWFISRYPIQANHSLKSYEKQNGKIIV